MRNTKIPHLSDHMEPITEYGSNRSGRVLRSLNRTICSSGGACFRMGWGVEHPFWLQIHSLDEIQMDAPLGCTIWMQRSIQTIIGCIPVWCILPACWLSVFWGMHTSRGVHTSGVGCIHLQSRRIHPFGCTACMHPTECTPSGASLGCISAGCTSHGCNSDWCTTWMHPPRCNPDGYTTPLMQPRWMHPRGQNDRCVWKHYLYHTSYAGGNNRIYNLWSPICPWHWSSDYKARVVTIFAWIFLLNCQKLSSITKRWDSDLDL